MVAAMKLIIQIPCYNEEQTLPQTIADLPKHISGITSIEVLIIDDGSTDGTVTVAHELGCHHIVSFARNRGLANSFMAGISACLRLGAGIIVNTDADNQYCGEDISKLVKPILDRRADIVIGERPIAATEHFSWAKKILQRLGSWVVRRASGTNIPDAPSGFRAYSRDAAMRLNVINDYTYTLETIIQAGRGRLAVLSVPVRTNAEIRPSRLVKSTSRYVKRSAQIIVRSFIMYNPMRFFFVGGAICFCIGAFFILRFLVYYFMGEGTGHIQSVVLATLLTLIAVSMFIAGLQADIIAANRKILEDIQYNLRKQNYTDNNSKEKP